MSKPVSSKRLTNRALLLTYLTHSHKQTHKRLFTMSDKIQRNPHPDFKKVEASRPPFNGSTIFNYTKTPNPEWSFGQGHNGLDKDIDTKKHVKIDPYEEGRPGVFNYKLLISAITPRPIAFLSTRSQDGTTNLAPFSYFNMINHDPPLFVVGFACGIAAAKDTLRNVVDSKEGVINIISETFIEAANSTSIDAPYGSSEWDVSGLTPLYDCETVSAARAKEAVFSVEVKVDTIKEYDSKVTEGKKSGTVVIFEGTRFWVREDALNEEKNLVDPAILRPMGRLGGITYSRTNEVIELTRPQFTKDLGGEEGFDKLKKSE